jgi:prophage regulatory protein
VHHQSRKTPPEAAASSKSAPRRMLNEQQSLGIIPISRSTVWRMVKAGQFPEGTFISPNRKIWFEDEILAWQNAIRDDTPWRGVAKKTREKEKAKGQ